MFAPKVVDGDLYIGAIGLNILMIIDGSVLMTLSERTHETIVEELLHANQNLLAGGHVRTVCRNLHRRIYQLVKRQVPGLRCLARRERMGIGEGPDGHTVVLVPY